MAPDDSRAARCPVCDRAYDSLSEHTGGLMVNLLANARYRRVCFDPALVEGEARVRFYHHTHDQAGTEPEAPAGRDEPVSREPAGEAPRRRSSPESSSPTDGGR
ncbi:hypothetical protein ACFO0N_18630 [Halobium salinum]|uniref:DUF8145 domain-containing protein n=1 Tax=Halobium salinum TaxID=1364940 RepID=A0ABD5PGR3_9EURY|nr:hypothetical protein [Halobium salinum]